MLDVLGKLIMIYLAQKGISCDEQFDEFQFTKSWVESPRSASDRVVQSGSERAVPVKASGAVLG